jgi:hypothetical protein
MTVRILRGFPTNFNSRRQIPHGRIKVDPEDNLSQGLIGAYLPGLFAGRNLAPPGGADMTVGSANGVGTPTYSTSGDGPGWKSTGDTSGLHCTAPASFHTWTAGFTLFIRGDFTLSSASGNNIAMGVEYGNPEASPYFVSAFLYRAPGISNWHGTRGERTRHHPPVWPSPMACSLWPGHSR